MHQTKNLFVTLEKVLGDEPFDLMTIEGERRAYPGDILVTFQDGSVWKTTPQVVNMLFSSAEHGVLYTMDCEKLKAFREALPKDSKYASSNRSGLVRFSNRFNELCELHSIPDKMSPIKMKGYEDQTEEGYPDHEPSTQTFLRICWTLGKSPMQLLTQVKLEGKQKKDAKDEKDDTLAKVWGGNDEH